MIIFFSCIVKLSSRFAELAKPCCRDREAQVRKARIGGEAPADAKKHEGGNGKIEITTGFQGACRTFAWCDLHPDESSIKKCLKRHSKSLLHLLAPRRFYATYPEPLSLTPPLEASASSRNGQTSSLTPNRRPPDPNMFRPLPLARYRKGHPRNSRNQCYLDFMTLSLLRHLYDRRSIDRRGRSERCSLSRTRTCLHLFHIRANRSISRRKVQRSPKGLEGVGRNGRPASAQISVLLPQRNHPDGYCTKDHPSQTSTQNASTAMWIWDKQSRLEPRRRWSRR